MLYTLRAGGEGRIRCSRCDLIYPLVPNELDVTPNPALQQGRTEHSAQPAVAPKHRQTQRYGLPEMDGAAYPGFSPVASKMPGVVLDGSGKTVPRR